MFGNSLGLMGRPPSYCTFACACGVFSWVAASGGERCENINIAAGPLWWIGHNLALFI